MDQEVSLYYIANEIATTYHGMMIAIPEPEWDLFYAMSLTELAAILQGVSPARKSESVSQKP